MAPKQRKHKEDRWLPQRVYRGKSAYEWHPKGGGAIKLMPLERDRNGELIETPDIRLKLLQAYDDKRSSLNERDTMIGLFDAYFKSGKFRRLSPQTQDDYRRYRDIVEPVFGKMEPIKVGIHHIRAFMDKKGEQHPVTANRCHSMMTSVFKWGLEYQYCRVNPCNGISKFKEKPRDRYIEDWEYSLVYEIAARHTHYCYLAPLMELQYLCRLRPNEACKLIEENLLEEGIFIDRGKGSDNEITAWSPRLKAAIDFARSLRENHPRMIKNQPLVSNSLGGKILMTTYKTAWSRIMKKAMTEGLEIDGQIVKLQERFTAHDIKAKGLTDHPEKYAGHRTQKMRQIYNRKPDVHCATK